MINEKDLKPQAKLVARLNIPKTYEQFVLEEQRVQSTEQEQAVAESYQAEFEAYGSVISASKSYGPCPEQYYSDSSGNYVKVTVEVDARAERAKKAKAWDYGFLEGCCYIYDLDEGRDPYRYGQSPWEAHKWSENIGYTGEVKQGRAAGRSYARKQVEVSHDPEYKDYPTEPKNPYKD